MPATPVDRLRTPLRRLRVILGDYGAPLSQEDFARMIGVSYGTLQSIENGRRPLGTEHLQQIKEALWAHWDKDAQEWRPLWDGSRVYTKEDAQAVAGLWPRDLYVQDLMVHCLLERLLAICGTIRPERLVSQVMRLNRLLGQYVKGSGLDVDLEATEPFWMLSTRPNVFGKSLPQEKIVWPRYQGHLGEQALPPKLDTGGIFDFRSQRRFDPAEYPIENPEEVDALVQKRTHRTKKSRENRGTLRAPKRKKGSQRVTSNGA